MSFRIHALPAEPFAPLFALSDAELTARGIRRVTATSEPGFPCRVSLEDARIGEELLLLNHAHLEGDTPYAARHAIFVRRGVARARPAMGEVPPVLRHRLLSVRAYDGARMMVEADVVDGVELAERLDAMLAGAAVEMVHIHNAKQGCFAAMATRD